MEGWAESDKARFMAGIVDLGAYYEMPNNATRTEWNQAIAYKEAVEAKGKTMFGDDIWDRENVYYASKYDSGNRDASEAILAADPELEQAMEWKQSQMLNDPIASKYYTSMSRVEQFYKGQMNRLIEDRIGMPVDQMFNTYNDLKLTDPKGASAYYKKYVKDYYEWSDWYQQAVADSVTRIAEGLADPVYPEIRPQAEQPSLGAEALAQPQEPTVYDRTWDEWRQDISVPLANLIQDYAHEGKPLSKDAMKQLDFLADNYYTNDTMLLEIIADSIRNRSAPYTELSNPDLAGANKQSLLDTGVDESPYLSNKAKYILNKNAMFFTPKEAGATLGEYSGRTFTLPETIARNQMAGFKRFATVVSDEAGEVTKLHEYAHVIDFVDGISDKKAFRDDMWKYFQTLSTPPKSSERSKVDWLEQFAFYFTTQAEYPDTLPSYVTKWFAPYVRN
jgi:hypothetical protein